MKSGHQLSVAVPERKQLSLRVSLAYRPVNKPTSGFQLYSGPSFWKPRQRQISSNGSSNAAHMAEFWNVISFVLPSYSITRKSETGCMQKITDVPCQISDLKDKHVLTASLISSYLFPEHCGFVMFSASAYSMLCLYGEVHHAWIRKQFDVKLTANYPRKLLRRKSPSGGLIRFTCNWVSQCGSFKWQNTSNNYNFK